MKSLILAALVAGLGTASAVTTNNVLHWRSHISFYSCPEHTNSLSGLQFNKQPIVGKAMTQYFVRTSPVGTWTTPDPTSSTPWTNALPYTNGVDYRLGEVSSQLFELDSAGYPTSLAKRYYYESIWVDYRFDPPGQMNGDPCCHAAYAFTITDTNWLDFHLTGTSVPQYAMTHTISKPTGSFGLTKPSRVECLRVVDAWDESDIDWKWDSADFEANWAVCYPPWQPVPPNVFPPTFPKSPLDNAPKLELRDDIFNMRTPFSLISTGAPNAYATIYTNGETDWVLASTFQYDSGGHAEVILTNWGLPEAGAFFMVVNTNTP